LLLAIFYIEYKLKDHLLGGFLILSYFKSNIFSFTLARTVFGLNLI